MSISNTVAASIAAIAVTVCAAIVVSVAGEKAGSVAHDYDVGTYQLMVMPEGPGVWRLNTSTGEIKVCNGKACFLVETGD